MNDEDIDYSDIPPLTDEQLAKMKPLREVLPQTGPNKVRITIRLDADIIKWFKDEVHQAGGGSYQSLLNQALRQYIESQKEPLEDTLRRVIREELQTVAG
ncbi:MAG: BrnA antitoxin family protein [Cytophagales bacterium]|nr:BrnA antitoxin family protein [Cytophagales bacterium]